MIDIEDRQWKSNINIILVLEGKKHKRIEYNKY